MDVIKQIYPRFIFFLVLLMAYGRILKWIPTLCTGKQKAVSQKIIV